MTPHPGMSEVGHHCTEGFWRSVRYTFDVDILVPIADKVYSRGQSSSLVPTVGDKSQRKNISQKRRDKSHQPS